MNEEKFFKRQRKRGNKISLACKADKVIFLEVVPLERLKPVGATCGKDGKVTFFYR